MYHNFKFISDDSSIIFFGLNPTTVSFGRKERTTLGVLDSIPKVHYQDTTTIIGSFTWENVPTNKTDYYTQILSLSNTSGVLHTSVFPRLVGRKNLLPNSQGFIYSNYWVLGCSGDLFSDGTTLSPDGISLAHKYTTGPSSASEGCVSQDPSKLSSVFTEHNVFSVYVKQGDANRLGVNMYNYTLGASHYVRFYWDGSDLKYYNKSSATSFGYENIGDGWYRIFIYYNATTDIGDDIRCYVYPHAEYGEDGGVNEGTYIWGAQLEHDVDEPTYYVRTEDSVLDEPLSIDFLDYQIEQNNTNGFVKHNIILNFKLTGTFL